MNNGNKKSSTPQWLKALIIVLVLLFAVAGEMDSDVLGIIVGSIIALGLVAGIVLATKKAILNRGEETEGGAGLVFKRNQVPEHNHDRLSGEVHRETPDEHWKKQLDGFLAAGLIDKAEYRVLYEKRRGVQYNANLYGDGE